MSDQKLHAEYSASGSHRWLHCPGSISLSKKAPPQRESEYAAEGTLAHKCLEGVLNYGIPNDLNLLTKYSTDMLIHAQNLTQWIHERQNSLPGSFVLGETRIDASSFTCPDQFGTLDAAIVQEYGELIVIDYKYGAGVFVDVEANTQLLYYALGIAHRYDYNFNTVTMVIDQPRAYSEDGITRRSWTISIEELMKWRVTFLNGVAESVLFPKLNAGDWCRWCPAAVICPEIKNKALERAQIVFDEDHQAMYFPQPKNIAIENLGFIMTACDQIEDWITKVREHALHVLERGEKIEGWKLVEKRATRKWKDEEEASFTARAILGPDAFSKPKLLSPAQIEKNFSGHYLRDFIEQNIIKESSGVTVVPSSDKREEVVKAIPFYGVEEEYVPVRLISTPHEESTTPRKRKTKEKKSV